MCKVEDGYVSEAEEEKFYAVNSMWNSIWLYDPQADNNCLANEEVYYICIKIQEELCFNVSLDNLPETLINNPSDFYIPDFNPQDFA